MKALFLLLLLIIMPSSAFAAGGPGYGMMVANFVIFAVIMFFLLRKPLAQMWGERIQNFDTEIRKGAIALEAAEKELEATKEKYADLDQSIKELGETIQIEAKQESEAVVKQASQQKLRILEQAKKNIERELEAQEKLIKQKFASEVCSKAEAKLKAEFSPEFDRSYRKASLEAAGGSAGIEKLARR